MFMISKLLYNTVYSQRKYLNIAPYNSENYISNFYYFRIGAEYCEDRVVPIDRSLTIPKWGFKAIYSMERFTLSERVLGLIGNISELILKGLQLVYSPSIDPGFDGALAMGIRNNTANTIELQKEERVGKVLFFDVSDSMVRADDLVQNIHKEEILKHRLNASEIILRRIFTDKKS